MSFLAWELQKAVFAAMEANAALTAVVPAAKMFDKVPKDEPFPYIIIGDSDENADRDTKDALLQTHFLTIEFITNAGGRMDIKIVQALIFDVLHDAPLTLDKGSLLCIRYINSSNVKDDEFKYIGSITFEAITEN